VTGSDSSLTSREGSFSQDLNGDGTLGSAGLVIEAFGQTQLTQNGNNFFLHTGGSDLAIKFGGGNVVPNQFGAWVPIAAEQTASGYQIAWKFGSADQYTIWTTDSSGNYITNTSVVTGSSSSLTSRESSFSQDLNGDGTISSSAAVLSAGLAGTDLNQTKQSNSLEAGWHSGGSLGENFNLRPDLGAADAIAPYITNGKLTTALLDVLDSQPHPLFQPANFELLSDHDVIGLKLVLADMHAGHFIIH
jgi:Tryptophan-rich Synechocystis species C-terminal domain